MDIVDRTQALVDEKGLSIAALERNTGLSNGIIKKWKKQSHSCDRVITIANYLNTSIEYLILGTVETKGLAFDVQQLLDYYNRLDKMEKGMVLGKAETLAELAAELAAERAAKEPRKNERRNRQRKRQSPSNLPPMSGSRPTSLKYAQLHTTIILRVQEQACFWTKRPAKR